LDKQRQSRGYTAEANQEQIGRDRIRLDIARRLRHACSHLGEEEFRLLVDEMTDQQLKGERRLNRNWPVE
jgi:hypothetical protein